MHSTKLLLYFPGLLATKTSQKPLLNDITKDSNIETGKEFTAFISLCYFYNSQISIS